jgi:hypothetical protein
MITPGINALGTLIAILTPWLLEAPQSSAAVVTASITRFGLADGLESCFVGITIKDGWHVYAGPAAAKETVKEDALAGITTDKARGVTFEVLLDGKSASMIDTWSHHGVVKTDAAGKKYRAYEGGTSFTVWLVWDETKNAKVLTARVRVVATDGKKRLKPAIVIAESR